MNTEQKAIAIFEYESGKRRALMPIYNGGLYLEWLDYTGMFLAGATCDNTEIRMSLLEILIGAKEVKVIKSPKSLYHCWHVCFCEDCSRFDGRVFDHSQATFNEHFKTVPVEKIFTFPTV